MMIMKATEIATVYDSMLWETLDDAKRRHLVTISEVVRDEERLDDIVVS